MIKGKKKKNQKIKLEKQRVDLNEDNKQRQSHEESKDQCYATMKFKFGSTKYPAPNGNDDEFGCTLPKRINSKKPQKAKIQLNYDSQPTNIAYDSDESTFYEQSTYLSVPSSQSSNIPAIVQSINYIDEVIKSHQILIKQFELQNPENLYGNRLDSLSYINQQFLIYKNQKLIQKTKKGFNNQILEQYQILYVCGSPGIGKTSGVISCINTFKQKINKNCSSIYINMMTIKSTSQLLTTLYEEIIEEQAKASWKNEVQKQFFKQLDKLNVGKIAYVIVLDEVDSITGGMNEQLLKILNKLSEVSSIRVIAIANSVNLLYDNKDTLIAPVKQILCECYSHQQIIQIIQERIKHAPLPIQYQNLYNSEGIKFLARKIFSQSSDIRKFMEIMIQASQEMIKLAQEQKENLQFQQAILEESDGVDQQVSDMIRIKSEDQLKNDMKVNLSHFALLIKSKFQSKLETLLQHIPELNKLLVGVLVKTLVAKNRLKLQIGQLLLQYSKFRESYKLGFMTRARMRQMIQELGVNGIIDIKKVKKRGAFQEYVELVLERKQVLAFFQANDFIKNWVVK